MAVQNQLFGHRVRFSMSLLKSVKATQLSILQYFRLSGTSCDHSNRMGTFQFEAVVPTGMKPAVT